MDSLGEGGAEQNLLTLVRRLRAPVCEHHLVWLYDDTALMEAFRPHVGSMLSLRAKRGIGLVGAAGRLAAHLRELRPDLVHAKLIRAQLVARVAARLAGRLPVLTTWECLSYSSKMYVELGRRGPYLRAVTRALDATTGITDRHFIAVSKQVAEYNAKKLGVSASRVSVVYNAIEPDRIVDFDEEELASVRRGLDVGSGPLLLSVGRLVGQKRHDVTIAAMPRILERHPTATLLIAGGGSLESDLQKQIVALGVGANVRLLGARKDVPALLKLADLFVFPSDYEGLGIALMEALAAGLPVAASHIPTSIEVAEGAGSVRYFEPGDSRGLAEAVIDTLSDLRASKDVARTDAGSVQQRFSPEGMAAQFLTIATRAADRRPRARAPQ